MPTIACKPQGNGTQRGWSLFVGAESAYLTVSDSSGTTHDSGDTYFRLPRRIGSGGVVSFPFFLGWYGGVPSQVVVNVVARRVAAAHPRIEIGFVRSGAFGFSGTLFDPPADWGLATRTFITDPISGLAWDAASMPMTEVCVRSEDLVVGNNDVTLVSASVTYALPRNHDPIMPHAVGLQ